MLLGVLLGLHVAGGAVALVSGPVPLVARKGGWWHRRAGDVFAAAMGMTSLSGIAIGALIGNVLLAVIGVFTFFLVFGGVRAVGFLRGGRPGILDDAVAVGTALFCGWLLWRGGGVTGWFFGVGGLVLSARQLWNLHSAVTRWLVIHLVGMCGAYIATVSAFLVVNIKFLPQALLFIGPTVLALPFLIWAIVHYGRDSRSFGLVKTNG